MSVEIDNPYGAQLKPWTVDDGRVLNPNDTLCAYVAYDDTGEPYLEGPFARNAPEELVENLSHIVLPRVITLGSAA